MPYPSEHAARQQPPGKYQRFRRENNKFGKGIHAIWGIKPNGDVELQSVRFDAKSFTPAQAKKWLADHNMSAGEFEAASGQYKST